MRFASVAEVKNRFSAYLARARREKKPIVVTHQGKPYALILPISEHDLEDLGWVQPIRLKAAARLPGGGLALAVEGQVGPLAAAGADLAALPARFSARFTAEESRPAGGPGFSPATPAASVHRSSSCTATSTGRASTV